MKNLALAFLLAFIGFSAAQQCGDTVTWSEALYDDDPDSLDDQNRTPLGFRRGLIIPNPELMESPPCVQIAFQDQIQYIEVAAEPVGFGNSEICVTLYSNDVAMTQPHCNQGLAYYCGKVVGNTNTLTAVFSCESSCDLSDIEIYYRAVISPSVDEDLENWCQNNRTMDFPSTLLTVVTPSEITPPDVITGGAMVTHPASLVTLFSFLLAIAFLRHYLNF